MGDKVLGRIGRVVYRVTDAGVVVRSDGTEVGPVDEFLKFLGGYLEDVGDTDAAG